MARRKVIEEVVEGAERYDVPEEATEAPPAEATGAAGPAEEGARVPPAEAPAGEAPAGEAAAPPAEAKPHPASLRNAELVFEMERGRGSKILFQVGKRRDGDAVFDIREYVDRPAREGNPGYSGPTRSGFRLHEENYEEFLAAIKAIGRKLGYAVE